MESLYCVKDKRKTPDVPGTAHIVIRKNGRKSLVTQCAICGINKQRFLPNDYEGSGLLGSLLGFPDGKVPLLSSLPLVGGLF